MTRPVPSRSRMGVRTLANLGVAVVLAALLSGCQGSVQTTVQVTGPESAEISVAAVFTDEAAAAVAESPQARAELTKVFTSRGGATPQVQITDTKVTASSVFSYDDLADSADVTGVAGLRLLKEGTVLEVDFVPASELAAVIEAENAGEPDAQALTQVMLSNVTVVVRARFDGGVTSADAGEAGELVVEESQVVFTRTAADSSSGVLRVQGDPSGSVPWWWWGAGAAAAAAVAALLRRRFRV